MITKKKVQLNNNSEENKIETFDSQFKKMIKEIVKEEEYFKTKDVKELTTTILNELEPLIAKLVKQHFYEIGKFMVLNSDDTTKENGDIKDAETS